MGDGRASSRPNSYRAYAAPPPLRVSTRPIAPGFRARSPQFPVSDQPPHAPATTHSATPVMATHSAHEFTTRAENPAGGIAVEIRGGAPRYAHWVALYRDVANRFPHHPRQNTHLGEKPTRDSPDTRETAGRVADVLPIRGSPLGEFHAPAPPKRDARRKVTRS